VESSEELRVLVLSDRKSYYENNNSNSCLLIYTDCARVQCILTGINILGKTGGQDHWNSLLIEAKQLNTL
jgi:hypothetical protein